MKRPLYFQLSSGARASLIRHYATSCHSISDRCSMKDPTVCRSCRFRKSKRVFFGEHLSVAPPDVPITKQSGDKPDVQSDSSPEDATAEDMTLEGGTDTENIPVESPPRTVQKTTAINKHAGRYEAMMVLGDGGAVMIGSEQPLSVRVRYGFSRYAHHSCLNLMPIAM